MILRVLFTAVFLLSFNSHAQEYAKVDLIVRSYPKQFNSSIELATRIKNDFNLQEEQVRAIYSWLSLNILYDNPNENFDIGDYRIVYFSEQDKLRQLDKKIKRKVNSVFKKKKALCLGFSQVFRDLCDILGIQSEIVFGYSKTDFNQINSNANYKNHAWNAVKIHNKWQLVDVTWATLGHLKNFQHYYSYYFFVDPKELIFTHFPVKQDWQLLEKPISKTDFFKTPIFYANYFIDKFKISDFQNGTLNIDDKMVYIYFDQIPRSKRVFYMLDGEIYAKPLIYKKTKKGNYRSSIRYNKNKNVIIYSNSLPVLNFAIK